MTELITLCGSVRYKDHFEKADELLTLAGYIVLKPGAFLHGSLHDGSNVSSEMKKKLDQLHLEKIGISKRVLVLDVDSYVGESTAREVQFANSFGIPVYYLSKGGLEFLIYKVPKSDPIVVSYLKKIENREIQHEAERIETHLVRKPDGN